MVKDPEWPTAASHEPDLTSHASTTGYSRPSPRQRHLSPQANPIETIRKRRSARQIRVDSLSCDGFRRDDRRVCNSICAAVRRRSPRTMEDGRAAISGWRSPASNMFSSLDGQSVGTVNMIVAIEQHITGCRLLGYLSERPVGAIEARNRHQTMVERVNEAANKHSIRSPTAVHGDNVPGKTTSHAYIAAGRPPRQVQRSRHGYAALSDLAVPRVLTGTPNREARIWDRNHRVALNAPQQAATNVRSRRRNWPPTRYAVSPRAPRSSIITSRYEHNRRDAGGDMAKLRLSSPGQPTPPLSTTSNAPTCGRVPISLIAPAMATMAPLDTARSTWSTPRPTARPESRILHQQLEDSSVNTELVAANLGPRSPVRSDFLRIALAYHRAGAAPGTLLKLYFGGDFDFSAASLRQLGTKSASAATRCARSKLS